MQRILILLLASMLWSQAALAQDTVITELEYKAQLYGPDGQLLANDTFGLQVTIYMEKPDGPRVYREQHRNVVSDSMGWFTIRIGKGTKPLGLLTAVKWLQDKYFLNIALDTSGNQQYFSRTTTQLLIVPVIKIIEKIVDAGPGPGEAEEDLSGYTHYLGEPFQGGLIVHLYKDSSGTEHGLIVSSANIADSVEWSSVSGRFAGTMMLPMLGEYNTQVAQVQDGHQYSAAKLCADYVSGEYTDWFMPDKEDLKNLYKGINRIAAFKKADPSYRGQDPGLQARFYWSSTEYMADRSYGVDLSTGELVWRYKYERHPVRAVRRF